MIAKDIVKRDKLTDNEGYSIKLYKDKKDKAPINLTIYNKVIDENKKTTLGQLIDYKDEGEPLKIYSKLTNNYKKERIADVLVLMSGQWLKGEEKKGDII